jgi:hypothetical protein
VKLALYVPVIYFCALLFRYLETPCNRYAGKLTTPAKKPVAKQEEV